MALTQKLFKVVGQIIKAIFYKKKKQERDLFSQEINSIDMDKKKSQWWISLYNALYLLGINQESMESLETEDYDPLDELETALDLGFCKDSLNYLLEQHWITLLEKEKLEKFKTFADNIQSEHWNYLDFNSYEDWLLLRDWARKLFKELKLVDRGWNSYGSTVIYTEDV